jgi:alpha-D-ribose 1-methylphosphonate 5-triphosphate diphosphatase
MSFCRLSEKISTSRPTPSSAVSAAQALARSRRLLWHGTATNDEAEIRENRQELVGALAAARGAGSLRAEHLLHLRCELACEDTVSELETLIGRDDVRLISLMDHTPGQRQFVSMTAYRTYYAGKTGMSAAELDAFIVERREAHGRLAATVRRDVVRLAHAHGIAIASHDDATEAHVEEAVADAAAIAEFPTTAAAARGAHAAGLKVLMGAPNFVRGGSHSGNVATEALAAERIVDILSSDYVPFSLLQTAFLIPRRLPSVGLADAIRLVTREPARAVGLDDRGEIAAGLRADLVRVRDDAAAPVVRSVWREGARIA